MNVIKLHVLALFFTAATALAGNPLDSWQTIQPKPMPQSFTTSFGGGRWVGFGNSLISSTNGIDWEGASLPHGYSFNSYKYANGLWVAGGNRFVHANCGGYNFRDGLFTSTNGLDWEDHAEVTQLLYDLGADPEFTDVAYGNGRWTVLGSRYGRYVTTTDSINWTPDGLGSYLSSSATTRSIAFGNGLWIITGDYGSSTGFLFASTDGLNWGTPIAAPAIFDRVTYGNGQWVACAQHQIWSSTNGLDWTSRYQGIAGNDSLSSATYANGRWVCVGYRYGSPYYIGLVVTSTDGLNWTLVRQDTARIYYSATYGDAQWVITGGDNAADQDNYIGALLTSTNGTTWADRTVQSTISTSKLKFDAGRWMSVGRYTNNGLITTSTDGVSWTNVTPTPAFSSCNAVAYGGNQWVALGVRTVFTPLFKQDLLTLTSSNGTSWLMRTNGVLNASALDFGQGQWVACYQSNVYTAFSPNFNWTPTLLPIAFRQGRFSDLHFANGLWVMGGSLDTATNSVPLIITSPNGTNWTQRTLSTANGSISAVTYAQGQWAAVGSEYIYFPTCDANISTALVLTSPDGTNWIQHDTGLPRSATNVFSASSLSGITWTGDEWVAAGMFDTFRPRSLILTSPDAIIWQIRSSIPGSGLGFAAYGNGKVVAGSTTTLFASAPITLAMPLVGLNRSGNQLLFALTGSIGATYDIQQTPQMSTPSSWTFLQSVTLSNSSQQILALPATGASAFWRARRL